MVELLGKQVKRSWYSMIKSLLVLTVLSLLSPLEKAEKSTFLFSAIDPQYEKEALSLNQSEVTEFGPVFFALLDLSGAEMGQIRDCVTKNEWALAFVLYRNHIINKLRPMDFGKFGAGHWHGVWLHDRHHELALELMERERERPDIKLQFTDHYGITAPPGRQTPIQWIQPGNKALQDHRFGFTTGFVSSYWRTGDSDFLVKYFDILQDFSINQKKQFDALPEAIRTDYRSPDRNYINWISGDAEAQLGQGARVNTFIKCLALFSKCVTPSARYPHRSWDDVLTPFTDPVLPEQAALIDPVAVAHIAKSIVVDHSTALLARYENPGAVPNQRREGISALLTASIVFSDFILVKESLFGRSADAMKSVVLGSVYPDGAYLERSFNYNQGDIDAMSEIRKLIQDVMPDFAQKIDQTQSRALRFRAAMSLPVGGLPLCGTYYYPNPPAFWLDPPSFELDQKTTNDSQFISFTNAEFNKEILFHDYEHDELRRSIVDALWKNQPQAAPVFTSIAFPYVGWYIMRDGWKHDSLFLALAASRPGRGHHAYDNNAINIVAYGRHLIVSGGSTWYTPNHAPEHQRDEFKQFHEYIGEDSAYKSCTIIVDGKAPTGRNVPIALEAYKEPIQSAWHTSEHFDFAEGKYDLGYGGSHNEFKRNSLDMKNLDDVTHRRLVFFLRKQKFWIVVDRLNSPSDTERTYTQIWRFPPLHNDKDESKSVVGFAQEQVHLDPRARLIHTADPDGPNIRLHSISAHNLKMRKYFGHKGEQYLGWYTRFLVGEVLPSTDIHVEWKGGDRQCVVTPIFPRAGKESQVLRMNPITKGGVTGFTCQLTNNTVVHYFSSNGSRPIQWDGYSIQAEELLLVEENGRTYGLILGAAEMVHGKRKMVFKEKDFEFEVKQGEFIKTEEITVPRGFRWQVDQKNVRPIYE
jgi:hypothetical protein